MLRKKKVFIKGNPKSFKTNGSRHETYGISTPSKHWSKRQKISAHHVLYVLSLAISPHVTRNKSLLKRARPWDEYGTEFAQNEFG